MSSQFGFIDIILLAMFAGFIILRLRNILGRKTGHQGKPMGGYFPKGMEVLKDIENNAHMYFVHSYEFIPENKNVISATTDYSSNIVCSVEKENIFGTQFHPEKSDKIGLRIIENFINI